MIIVRENGDSFEPVRGNPTILSLDGTRKSRLAVIMHQSWTAEQRAEYGIYVVEPVVIPNGKQQDGDPSYERVDGKIIQVMPMKDAPIKEQNSTPIDDLRTDMEALAVRITELEAANGRGNGNSQ